MTPAAIVFLLATAAVIYILIGYPLLLGLTRGRTPRPVRKDLHYEPTVSVLMTVYNGESFIRQKLESLLALDYPAARVEIIVVSDGSTDGTDEAVLAFQKRGVRLLRVPHAGKAAALTAGLGAATGEILFFTDVRQPLEPEALRHLVANFADPEVGAVTGELCLLRGDTGEQADMDLYWRYEVWARKRHSAIYSLFNTTGCLYAMRRSLAAPIPPDTLTDDAVLPLRAYFRGYRIIHEPEAIAYDYPAVSGTEFRRRVRTLGGLWQTYARMPQLLLRPHRMWLHFTSHKFARLVLPWAVLAVFVSTAFLPAGAFRDSMLVSEAGLPLLALGDLAVPRSHPLKRLTSPARTFLLMNAAALFAILVFFVSPKRFWKPTQVAHRHAAGSPR